MKKLLILPLLLISFGAFSQTDYKVYKKSVSDTLEMRSKLENLETSLENVYDVDGTDNAAERFFIENEVQRIKEEYNINQTPKREDYY